MDILRTEKSRETSHVVRAVHSYDSFSTDGKTSERPLESHAGHRLRRFWVRSIVGVVAPLVVLGYYLTIWRVYLAPLDASAGFVVSPPGAKYIYYGWFIAGILGLNLSLYSLAGVEAAMLMHPTWDVGDAMSLMMHADGTWSGPGGWFKTAKRLVRMRKSPRGSAWPSRLWCVLAAPSSIVFVAWPLSGLSFELTSGYVRPGRLATAATPPNVTGFSYANFNERLAGDETGGARVTWQYAQDAAVPGMGVVYTQPGTEAFSQRSLPKEDGVPQIFLTAQAQNPIEGSSWGLAVRYNCSVVKSMSEFTLLKYQDSAGQNDSTPRLQTTDPGATVYKANETFSGNLLTATEFAYRKFPNASAYSRLVEENPYLYPVINQDCYYNQFANITGNYPHLEDEDIFEIVLWQHLFTPSYTSPPPTYNTTLGDTIAELYGVYQGPPSPDVGPPMAAVGVRCSSSSDVGTADIDGVHSTYTNFVRTDTPINFQSTRCARRFGAQGLANVLPFLLAGDDNEAMGALFTSSGAPGPFDGSYDPSSPFDAGGHIEVQLNYLQAADMRRSLLRAYAAYAVQLMYNGGQGYTAVDGTHTTFANPNVTEYLAGAVLTPGIVPPELPALMFLLWAVAVPALCIMYGFRPRWSPTLDGYSLFRFGADISGAGKTRIAAFSNTRGVEECEALHGLPGFVGDKRPQAEVGQIALVDGVPAAKSKLYD